MSKGMFMKDEQQLIAQALAGSEAAFEKLISTYMRDVYYISLSIVKNHFDADDVQSQGMLPCGSILAMIDTRGSTDYLSKKILRGCLFRGLIP